MKKALSLVGVMVLAAATALAAPDRWLHVRVINHGGKEESVSVNLPLELAEKVLPTLQVGELKDGKIRIPAEIQGVDVPAVLETIRQAGDNEYVSVKSPQGNVRVAKAGDFLLVKVRNGRRRFQNVDVRIPIPVAKALFSSGNDNELDLVAAVRAFETFGDTDLVTVRGEKNNVHIWIDSKNDSD